MGRRRNDPDARIRTIDLAVAQRLKQLRKEKQAQIDDIAAFVGISPGQFAKYESCANRISATVLFNAARYLNVSVKDLFSLVEISAARRSPQLARLEELIRHFSAIDDVVLQRGLVEFSRFLRAAGREDDDTDRLTGSGFDAAVERLARRREAEPPRTLDEHPG